MPVLIQTEERELQSTLPRGERLHTSPKQMLQMRLQSTLPRGERLVLVLLKGMDKTLQSTLPRGERLCGTQSGRSGGCFNPRSRAGSDKSG